MYLTRFLVNHSRVALGWISNPYRVHQRLRMAYPNEPRLLFRIEESSAGSQILAQSVAKPEWKSAFMDFDILVTEPETKEFVLKLVSGGLYRFRLLANPVVTRDGKRLGLLNEEVQRAWLDRQMEKAGAKSLGCQVKDNGLLHSKKNPDKDTGIQVHQSVLYDGVLQVVEREKLEHSLATGIGPGKGYGFGLLSLAPYRN